MSTKVTYIRLAWPGGVHRFEIKPPGSGATDSLGFTGMPALHDRERAILGRLVGAMWGREDIFHTIRCGLLGGGDFKPGPRMFETWREVDDLIARVSAGRPLADFLPLAQTILLAAITGVDADLAERGLDPVTVTLGDAVEAIKADA